MKYLIACLTLLATLAAGAQTNTYYNPDAEPDGQIGSSDLLEFLPLFGNSFTPDTCLCGCPSGGELDELLAQDTLNTFSFAALAFQHNADSIELTIHLDSYGIGDYPFLGDTIIEYPCLTYTTLLQRTCYQFDNGELSYSSYPIGYPGPPSYCGLSAGYIGIYFDDDAPNIEATHPNVSGNGAYDSYWSFPEYGHYVQLSTDTWAMLPDGFSDSEPPPTRCFDYLEGNSWDVCFRLVGMEVRFID